MKKIRLGVIGLGCRGSTLLGTILATGDAQVTAVCDLLSLAIFKEPAAWGADIAVGSAQRFGLPMGFGGPVAGWMATKDDHKRFIPGRIIGISIDRLGKPAYRHTDT